MARPQATSDAGLRPEPEERGRSNRTIWEAAVRIISKLYLSLGLLLAIAVGGASLAILCAREASNRVEYLNLAHQEYEAYLALSNHTYQLFKQFGDAMLIGDRDRPFQTDNLSQHVSAANDRDASGARGLDLNIIILDRAGNDHSAGAGNIFGDMPNMHHCAFLAQALDIGTFLHVRALHLIAQVHHDLGNAGHANAANTNKMCGAERERGRRRFHLVIMSRNRCVDCA